ncbi:MAG TPA: transposase [Terriglobia bacterium]|nr:transposase [Terriglobia bacterium]
MREGFPELLNFYAFPYHLWKRLRTTNTVECWFVKERRRTRPMVVFTDVRSLDRIIDAIFNGFNEGWHERALKLFTKRT